MGKFRGPSDEMVQAVTEAMHADLCPDDECDGSDMGEWERQAEIVTAAARPHLAAEALRDAADAWRGGMTGRGVHVPTWWLHERADQIDASHNQEDE